MRLPYSNMALHRVNTDDYQQQLHQKAKRLAEAYREFTDLEPELFPSPPIHYRLRAEFKVWHEGGVAHYAMYRQGEYKKPFIIDTFTVGSELMNQLMPKVLEAVNSSEVLRKRLFSAEFLTTLSGDALITLIYHKSWMKSGSKKPQPYRKNWAFPY